MNQPVTISWYIFMQLLAAELETAFGFIRNNYIKMKIVNAAGESVAPTLPL